MFVCRIRPFLARKANRISNGLFALWLFPARRAGMPALYRGRKGNLSAPFILSTRGAYLLYMFIIYNAEVSRILREICLFQIRGNIYTFRFPKSSQENYNFDLKFILSSRNMNSLTRILLRICSSIFIL